MSDKKKKSWFMRFVRGIIFLCLLGVILVWVAKIWVLPPLIRGAANSYLGDAWSGTIEIGSVEVNIFAPSYVRGVTVSDGLGRVWLDVPEIRLDTAWDGYVPRLEGIRVAVVTATPHFVDGKCAVPLKRTESSDDPADLVAIIDGLQEIELSIGVARLQAVNHVSPAEGTLDGMLLPAVLARSLSRANITFPCIEWRGGKLSVDKVRGEIGGGQISIDMGGGLQPDQSIRFRGHGLLLAAEETLDGKFEINFKPGGVVQFKMGYTGQVQVDFHGDIQGDGQANTTLDVLASNVQPDEFEWLIGSNEIVWLALESSDVKIHLETIVNADMSATATGRIDLSGPIGQGNAIIKGQHASDGSGQVTAKITGTPCDGTLQADLKTVYRPDAPVKLTLEASAENVKMAELTRILVPDRVMEKGTGKGMIHFEISGADTASIRGRGAFFLDDANLWKMPILAAVFKYMKLKLGKSDIQARFDLKGTNATLVTGQLATMLWAADFEPGGTFDYYSEKVDMYVMFLPIKHAGILLNIFKAINPLNLIAKQVFRLHITGTRNNPKITPVPFRDLKVLPAGALGLLKSVTASGGQLGGNIFNAILNGGK
jgi:hypothetical protein